MEELELTYLAKQLPKGFENARSKEMLDVYIPSSAKHPDLRIRKIDERREITKKQPVKGGDSSCQLETTIPLTSDEYTELSRLKGKRVEKTRYYYEERGANYEIDVFKGGLEGLVLVDVEFDSLEKQKTFIAPEWCLADVTQEKLFAGGMLAGKNYTDIESELIKFGYKKLHAD